MSERQATLKLIATAFPDALLPSPRHDAGSIAVRPRRLDAVGELLRDDPELRYDLLLAIARHAGYLYYQLASTGRRHRGRLCVPIDEGQVRSLAFVWPAANWAEREAGERWGVEFVGHPRPDPLFTPPDLAGQDACAPADGRLIVTGARCPASIEGLFVRLPPVDAPTGGAEPVLGYRRVGVEDRMAGWHYRHGTLLAARVDACAAMHGDLAYALAAERLLGVVPPPRARRLRTIYGELQRLASHLDWLVRFGQRVCGPLPAAISYAWEGRSALLDFFQWLGGNPVTPDLVVVGGLRSDAPVGWEEELGSLLLRLDALLDDLNLLLTDSVDFRSRLEGLGVIDPGTALGLGVTGPALRATGIAYDVRTAFPYDDWAALGLDVPVGRAGDALARYRVRMAEMRAGIAAIRRAMADVPPGAVNAFSSAAAPSVLPDGVAYASVEGARGEWGVLLVGEGTACPASVYLRTPSFANLSALPFLTGGLPPESVRLVIDSLDVSVGEVER